MLYGANEEAKKNLSAKRRKKGRFYFRSRPGGIISFWPPAPIWQTVFFRLARSMVHLEKDQGKIPFSLG